MTDFLKLLEHRPTTTPISILPIPFDLGSDQGETLAEGPRYLLGLGLVEVLTKAGLTVEQAPEVGVSKKHLGNGHKSKEALLEDTLVALHLIKIATAHELAKGNKLACIGGDHTLAIGTLAAALEYCEREKQTLGLIYIDVHGDLHTHETSWSQNVHGMALAIVLGHGTNGLKEIVSLPLLAEHALFVGALHFENAEVEFVRREKLPTITMPEITTHGLAPALAAVEALASKVDHLWVSIDVDGIDESVAPASAMAGQGGLSYQQVTTLLSAIGRTNKVLGIDVVELTPDKDKNNKTGDLCMELVAEAFGAKASSYARHMREYL